MATELRLVRTLRGFEASDDESREAMKALKLGAPFKCEVRIARDSGRIRWWWKLCDIIAENSEYWPTKEAASDSLKMGIGIFDTYIEKDQDRGVWIEKRKPGSIALSNKTMTEDKFRAFCIRAQNYVCTDMLVGANVDDLERELEAYLNPDGRRAA